jgi:serine-type D-Ala-D-Ala carboxypeptidase/endopeptidase
MNTFLSARSRSNWGAPRAVLYGLLTLLTAACAATPALMPPCEPATLPPATAQQATQAAAEADRYFPAPDDIRTMLRYLVEDGETPGIVLGLIEADGSTHVYYHGEAGPGAHPLGPKSVFEIGSITKTFTGALLADMVARGEMRYDDPVQMYLPEGVTMPTWGDRQITLEDLATLFSGLPRRPDNFAPADRANPWFDYTPELLYEFLSGHELRRAPGTEYEYSNLAVGLLGHVLELHTGMTYEQLVRERILDPLRMEMTGVELRGALAEWMTRGHDEDGQVVPYWDVISLAGMGGLRSNVEDLLTYARAHLEPPETPVERALHATLEVRAQITEKAGHTLGWQSWEPGARRMLLQGGSTGGYDAMVGFDRDLGVGVVLLTNSGGYEDEIAGDFLECGPPLDLGDVDVPEEVLKEYVGSYRAGAGRELYVRLEPEGWLTVQRPDFVRSRMYAENHSHFYLRRTPWRFWFQRDEAGEVTGLVVDHAGQQWHARKTGDETPSPQEVAGHRVNKFLDILLSLAR